MEETKSHWSSSLVIKMRDQTMQHYFCLKASDYTAIWLKMVLNDIIGGISNCNGQLVCYQTKYIISQKDNNEGEELSQVMMPSWNL